MDDQKLLTGAQTHLFGAYWQEHLRRLAMRYEMIGDVRVRCGRAVGVFT